MKRHQHHVCGASDPGKVDNYQRTDYIPSAVSSSDAGKKHHLVGTRTLVEFDFENTAVQYVGGAQDLLENKS